MEDRVHGVTCIEGDGLYAVLHFAEDIQQAAALGGEHPLVAAASKGTNVQRLQVDVQHARCEGTIADQQDTAWSGDLRHICQRVHHAGDRVDMHEADDAAPWCQVLLEDTQEMLFVLNRIRHPHVVDLHAPMFVQVFPAGRAAAMFMVRCQDLVTSVQLDAGGDLIHAFGRIARDHDFADIRTDELGGAGTHLFGPITETTPDVVDLIAFQLVEIAADSVGDDTWRGADTACVEMDESLVELEFLAHAAPQVGFADGGVDVGPQRLQSVLGALGQPRQQPYGRRRGCQTIHKCTLFHDADAPLRVSVYLPFLQRANRTCTRLWSWGARPLFESAPWRIGANTRARESGGIMDANRASACSYPLKEQSLDYALKVIGESGFSKVDLLARMPHFSVTDPEYSVDELERLCDLHGVRVANIGAYCGGAFSSQVETERQAAVDEMNITLDVAKRLGARTVRVAPGTGKRDEIDTLVPYFKAAAETAERFGIWLGIENHGSEISGNPEACVEISEKVGSPHFGVLYEPSNLMDANVDYKEAFEIFKDHIVHVHIKDGSYNAAGKWERCMLGDGVIDVTWVWDRVEALGYTGQYALEFEVGDIEKVETGYAKWLQYWEAL